MAVTVTEAALEEMLRGALRQSVEAPNRAVKRRVRQRLHKRLGAMLSSDRFEVAVQRFRQMESQVTEERVSHSPEAKPAPTLCPAMMPCVFVPLPAVSIKGGACTTTSYPWICAVQHVRPVKEQVQVPKRQALVSVGSSSSTDFVDVDETSSEWSQMCEWRSADLPVERTFVHFRVREPTRRRSKSL